MSVIKPYGSWPSPVTAESLTSGAPAADICIDKTTGAVYWRENVATEGRYQIFTRSLDGTGETRALLPEGYNCRTRVHEYGGGSLKVQNGLLIFSNDSDSRLYAIDLVNSPTVIKPVTPDSGNLMRYADMDIDPTCKFLVCVREQHFEKEEPKDVLNTLVLVKLDTGSVQVIAEGCDFYSSPRLYGSQLAYVCWNHSNMPWDSTQLCLATLTPKGTLASSEFIAGKTIEESIVQPVFGSDGTLYFASDRSGFWNLYRYSSNNNNNVELLLPEPLPQEFAGAAWTFNLSWFTPCESDPAKLICINRDSLAVLDTVKKTLTNLEGLPYDNFDQIRSAFYDAQELVVLNVSSTTSPKELVAYSMQTKSIVLLRGSTAPVLDPAYISVGKEIEFPTSEGKTAYAYFYEPKNPECRAPEGEKPPLRTISHGGPTTATTNAYSRDIQYWTTRGFAVVDVNYGGSTGYGREYRNRLKLKWGIVDVDDCCNAARYLADKGLVDPKKLAIEGGSAGGYTTLASLAFRDVFNAGCSSYGISDITLLAQETHKFESRYPDQLIPRDEKVYRERSPIHSADKISCPVIFFQGLEDKVVPPSQSALMVETLKKTGVPVAYVEYEGEGHGFRRAENIKRTLDLKLWFYGQIFGFPVEGVEGIKIYNYHEGSNL